MFGTNQTPQGRRRLPKPSPALIVAMLALFMAMTQTGLASRALEAAGCNCATSEDIKDNSLRGVDIKNGSLGRPEFKKGTLVPGPRGPQGPEGKTGPQGPTGAQGPAGERGAQGDRGFSGERGEQGIQGERGLQGATGPVGAQGPQGIQGIQGIQGPPGFSGLQVVETAAVVIAGNAWHEFFIDCPAGKKAIGGGLNGSINFESARIMLSYQDDADTWDVWAKNQSGSSMTVRASAICVTVGS